MTDAAPSSTVKSAMRTLDILELLVAQGRPLAAHEISTALAIPVSSLSYLLNTLADRGYVERTGRRYGPGDGLVRLQPRETADTLIELVGPVIRSLKVRLNETAGFFVPKGHEVEAAVSEIGNHALKYTLEVGQHAPMHAFAAGKAILATYDETALADYFASSERKAFTARTLTDESDLRAELAERTGRTSVPAVYVGGQFIGGCNDGGMGGVLTLDKAGKLKPLLRAAGCMP